MKCTRIQRIVLESDEAELTHEILSHVESCPACGEHYRQSCSCRRLVALKRYEIPSELRREACLAELHGRLLYLQDQRDHAGFSRHPAFRYGLAAAVVAMVAAHLAAMSVAPALRSPVTAADLRSRSFEEFIRDRNTLIADGLLGPELFETYPTMATNLPPARTRPPSIFFVDD